MNIELRLAAWGGLTPLSSIRTFSVFATAPKSPKGDLMSILLLFVIF